MTEAPSTFTSSTKYAVVTGANKGIGFEICRQLASKGVTVVLTARDEKRGLDAVEKLKDSGISDHLIFHQLDVADPTSIDSLADFIKTKFGRLDILINNAGISGGIINLDAYRAARSAGAVEVDDPQVNWSEIVAQTYELAEECLKVNYYGAKRMIEAFVPLLQLSSSARIVNVSSSMGRLQRINYEWVKGVLSDVENLTVEGIDNILNEFLKDFKDGLSTAKGWPAVFSSYIVSKAAMNAYTRMLAKKYPNFLINCACPGFVKTDINNNTGTLTVEEGAEGLVMLALLPDGGPSGLFFFRKEVSPFE